MILSIQFNSLIVFTFFSSLYRISRMGGGPRRNGGRTFLHWRNKKFRVFSNSKMFKNVKKSMKIFQFWENYQIYIQKSQLKTDFLTIFSPIFQEFCHFIHLCNIPKLGVRGEVVLCRVWGYLRVWGVRGCINPFN